MKKPLRAEPGPSAKSLREMPEVDPRNAVHNPFAQSVRRTGIRIVGIAPVRRGARAIAENPSAASLREMPERDLSRARRDPARFAVPMATRGFILRVGRGRPSVGQEVGPTTARSIRFPDAVWKEIERVAKREGLSVHAALRIAVIAWKDSENSRR
jgi:hypothetical protein